MRAEQFASAGTVNVGGIYYRYDVRLLMPEMLSQHVSSKYVHYSNGDYQNHGNVVTVGVGTAGPSALGQIAGDHVYLYLYQDNVNSLMNGSWAGFTWSGLNTEIFAQELGHRLKI